MKRSWLLIAAALGLASVAAADASVGGWRVVESERGITVSMRDQPGSDLPAFRGQGTIEGEVLYVLAVVLDVKGAMEWAEGADETDLLRELDPRTHLIYSHTDVPWPVTDRDMVMKRSLEVVKSGEEYRLQLDCVNEGKAPQEGIIRINDCTSNFILRRVDADHTSIDYQVRIDPEGSLPKWLVAWAARKVPFDTLINLEAQVKKTRSKYKSTALALASAR